MNKYYITLDGIVVGEISIDNFITYLDVAKILGVKENTLALFRK